jgi:hypothetical protein
VIRLVAHNPTRGARSHYLAQNGRMADDEIERLLREVAGTTGNGTASSAGAGTSPAAR